METLETKTTYLGNGLYGCRVINALTKKPIVELQVTKELISCAYYDMLRTLDKMGHDSHMAHSSRHRGKNHVVNAKYIWY